MKKTVNCPICDFSYGVKGDLEDNKHLDEKLLEDSLRNILSKEIGNHIIDEHSHLV